MRSIELIFLNTYIAVMLKRDKMIHSECGNELNELVNATREFQVSIPEGPEF